MTPPATGPLEMYERALSAPGGVHVRYDDGSVAALPIARYLGGVDVADRELLAGVTGPVLDVGCGPGRHLGALSAAGVYALGVDLSPVAVAVARRRGGRAVVGDVFGEVPGAGTWATALLLDGNIGIGGRPGRLLSRLGTLLRGDGVVLVELEAPHVRTLTSQVRIESGEEVSAWCAWARVSTSQIDAIAEAAAMTVEETWRCGERWFARLRSTPTP